MKAGIAFMVFWTAWVIYRTSGNYELLGYDLYRWDVAEFWSNLLGFPFVIGLIYLACRWVMKEQKPKPDPLIEFQRELDTWPVDQAKAAELLLKAFSVDDRQAMEKWSAPLNQVQLQKVREVLKKI